MPSIVVRLDPGELENPDLDLRYEIPNALTQQSGGAIFENGYDYEPDGNALHIYLLTSDLSRAVAHIISFLESAHPHGNDLSKAAQLGVSEQDDEQVQEYSIVYPVGHEGVIQARS